MSISIQFSAVTERIQSRNRFLNRTMATSQKKKKGMWRSLVHSFLLQSVSAIEGWERSEIF